MGFSRSGDYRVCIGWNPLSHLLLKVVGYGRELLSSFAVHGVLESGMVGIQVRTVHEDILSLVQVGDLSRKPHHVPEI